jgi:hypothetical protein
MGIPKITELSSRLIHELGTNRYVLRLVKVGESEPPQKKFGISRLWYNVEINSWLPSKNNHVYLPVSAVQTFKRAFDQLAVELEDGKHGNNDDGGTDDDDEKGPSCGSAEANGCPTTVSETVEQSVVTTSVTASAPKSDVAAKRKRGRPCLRNRFEAENAPRFNVHIDAESGSDTIECEKNVRSVQTEATIA